MYPIELFLGGTTGNVGTGPVSQASSQANGVFTIFFELPATQKYWAEKLEEVTDSYNIKDHYDFGK